MVSVRHRGISLDLTDTTTPASDRFHDTVVALVVTDDTRHVIMAMCVRFVVMAMNPSTGVTSDEGLPRLSDIGVPRLSDTGKLIS